MGTFHIVICSNCNAEQTIPDSEIDHWDGIGFYKCSNCGDGQVVASKIFLEKYSLK